MAVDVPRFPKGTSTARTCRLLIESLPTGAPSLWRIRPRDGRRPASDALCRAPLEGAPDSLPPPPRQRTAILSNQSAFHRRRAPSAMLSRGGEERRAPTSAISASMWKRLLRGSILRSEPLDVQVRLAVPSWPRAARDGLQHTLRFTSTTGISRTPFVRSSRLPPRCAFWVASPFQDLTSRASLAQGLEYGFRRFEHPPSRLLAPRLVTPTRVTRTPSVVSS